jgi:hypothetical protein
MTKLQYLAKVRELELEVQQWKAAYYQAVKRDERVIRTLRQEVRPS